MKYQLLPYNNIPGGHLLQANDIAKVGLASLFADMMNEDTKNYTAEQMSSGIAKIRQFCQC